MTIPTRDELIASAAQRSCDVADFALAEIRRELIEELESLRRTRGHRVIASDVFSSGWNAAVDFFCERIDARLAALRASQSEASQRPGGAMRQTEQPPGAATVAEPLPKSAPKKAGDAAGSTPAPGATNVAAPALSDADALDEAAEILDKSTRGLGGVVREVAAKLRAASAPEPVDVFEAFQSWKLTRSPGVQLDRAARDWFGPLVAALEAIEAENSTKWDCGASITARSALAALRQRAQEASR